MADPDYLTSKYTEYKPLRFVIGADAVEAWTKKNIHKTLLSRDDVTFVDLICEGPIEGPIDAEGNLVMNSPERSSDRVEDVYDKKYSYGTKDYGPKLLYETIEVNGTPIKNFKKDTWNFRHISAEMRRGWNNSLPYAMPRDYDKGYDDPNIPEVAGQRNASVVDAKLIGTTKNTQNLNEAIEAGAVPYSFILRDHRVREVIITFQVMLIDNAGANYGAGVDFGIRIGCENASLPEEEFYNPLAEYFSYDDPSYRYSKDVTYGVPNYRPSAVKVIDAGGEMNTLAIYGRATSPARLSIKVRLPKERNPRNGNRIINLYKLAQEDPESTKTVNCSVHSIVEIIPQSLQYPNSATCAIKLDSRSIGSNPKRTYNLKLLKVYVPSNYTPWTERTKRGDNLYKGYWDGTFKLAWTMNPAWCMLDLMTNKKHGLGKFGISGDNIDKWGLYEISKYCDAVDSNGNWEGILKYGRTLEIVGENPSASYSFMYEPRYTCNCMISQKQEAFDLLYNLASTFYGMLFWNYGSLFTSIDKEKDPIMMFSNSDITEEGFNYSSTSKTTRITVVKVRYNDAEQDYQSAIAYAEDAEAIKKYGIIEKDIVAFACTSKGQAHRLANWALFTSQNEKESLQFSTGSKAAHLKPGDIIKVLDQGHETSKLSGRIVSIDARASTIKIDYPIHHLINVDTTYSSSNGSDFPLRLKVTVSKVDDPIPGESDSTVAPWGEGSVGDRRTIKDLKITRIEEDGLTLHVRDYDAGSHLGGPKIPEVLSLLEIGSSWLIDDEKKNPEVRTREFRVISINQDSQSKYQISALEYDRTKFKFTEDVAINSSPKTYSLQGVDLSREKYIDDPVIDVELHWHGTREKHSQDSYDGIFRVGVFWEPIDGIDEYAFYIKLDGVHLENFRVKIEDAVVWKEKYGMPEYAGKLHAKSSRSLPSHAGRLTVEAFSIKDGVFSSSVNPVPVKDSPSDSTKVNSFGKNPPNEVEFSNLLNSQK